MKLFNYLGLLLGTVIILICTYFVLVGYEELGTRLPRYKILVVIILGYITGGLLVSLCVDELVKLKR